GNSIGSIAISTATPVPSRRTHNNSTRPTRMVVTSEYVNVPSSGGTIRAFVAAPKAEGRYPGIWCYSDIFQLTPPMLRSCVRLAGYGFVAAAPEIYARIEPLGTVIPFDDAGRTRGQQDAAKTPVAHFDADCRAGL